MSDYRVIDADAHFNEPNEVWTEYLEARYHPDAPRMVHDSQGRIRGMIGGELLPFIPPPPRTGPRVKKEGATSAQARLADMDGEGIDVMAIYPTEGLYIFGVKDPALSTALARAYNRWASDFCKADPRRLIAPALMPQIDPSACLAEAKTAIGELGMRGALMRPNPIGGRAFDHPAFDPLWSFLEEVGAPLILHEGTTQDVPQVGNDRFDNFMFKHIVSHPFEQQMALMNLICGGVLERHPGLNVLVVECGTGWVPYWMDRLDDHAIHWAHASAPLKEKPSDYFRRECFVAAEGAEGLIPFTIDAFGDDNICFSTDYPHPDHPFFGMVADIKAMEGVSDASKAKILGTNAARCSAFERGWGRPDELRPGGPRRAAGGRFGRGPVRGRRGDHR